MKDIIQKIFVDNWIRKIISLLLATIIWFLVHKSLTTSTNYHYINSNITQTQNLS